MDEGEQARSAAEFSRKCIAEAFSTARRESQRDKKKSFMDILEQKIDEAQECAKELWITEVRKKEAECREAERRQGQIPSNDRVQVHGLKGSKAASLNGRIFEVLRYDKTSKRYVLHELNANDKVVGAFKEVNLRVVDTFEMSRQEQIKFAARYNPRGPHPPENYDNVSDEINFVLVPLLEVMCPAIDRVPPDNICMTCDKRTNQNSMCCSRCKTAFFCSTICQKQSWSDHKKACTTRERRMQLLRHKIIMSFMGNVPSKLDLYTGGKRPERCSGYCQRVRGWCLCHDCCLRLSVLCLALRSRVQPD